MINDEQGREINEGASALDLVSTENIQKKHPTFSSVGVQNQRKSSVKKRRSRSVNHYIGTAG
jgi:hypothetical protein